MRQAKRVGLSAVVGGLVMGMFGIAPAQAAAGTDRLGPGESISAQQELVSPNGQYTARVSDGNLVVFRAGFGVRWTSGHLPADPNAKLTLQPDGNLVLVSGNKPRWSANTSGASSVQLRNDGNLVVSKGSTPQGGSAPGTLAWQSGSAAPMDVTGAGLPTGATLISPNGRARLSMQRDGNLVAYRDGAVTWKSNTGQPGSRLVLSTTIGPAILDINDQIQWTANAPVKGAASTLSIDDEGIVKLTTAGTVAWESVHRPAANCASVGGPVPASDTRVTSNGIRMHACAVDNVQRMVNDAAAQGILLNGSGWRDTQRQIELRIQNCGGNNYESIWVKPSGQCSPPTAIPGRSMHERGLAIDFKNSGTRSTANYQWLAANAARYGFYNLPSEPWHWSTNGG